jgi:hypothetical protein
MILSDSGGNMPARRGEAWNDEDIRILREMYRGGSTNEVIAHALERTKASVAARVGIMRRRRLLGLMQPDER